MITNSMYKLSTCYNNDSDIDSEDSHGNFAV